jgi:hypothetical protein
MSEDEDALRDALDQRVSPTCELRQLTRQLFERRRAGEGRILQHQDFEGARIHDCFNNAVAWAEAHPGHALVYGFLYYDYQYELRHVRFVPHVVVQTENGEWLDVTPHHAEDDHPFLQHAGTEQEFQAAMLHGPMDHVYR